jgi:hypothetical protein
MIDDFELDGLADSAAKAEGDVASMAAELTVFTLPLILDVPSDLLSKK